jgi:hypothetical protein
VLHELRNVRQVPGDHFRRWFSDENLEIVVWYGEDGAIFGFQVCYDPRDQPRALTWTQKRGFSHATVDAGEDKPTSNRTPMLSPSHDYDAAKVREAFRTAAAGLPEKERAFIESKLAESATLE